MQLFKSSILYTDSTTTLVLLSLCLTKPAAQTKLLNSLSLLSNLGFSDGVEMQQGMDFCFFILFSSWLGPLIYIWGHSLQCCFWTLKYTYTKDPTHTHTLYTPVPNVFHMCFFYSHNRFSLILICAAVCSGSVQAQRLSSVSPRPEAFNYASSLDLFSRICVYIWNYY